MIRLQNRALNTFFYRFEILKLLKGLTNNPSCFGTITFIYIEKIYVAYLFKHLVN